MQIAVRLDIIIKGLRSTATPERTSLIDLLRSGSAKVNYLDYEISSDNSDGIVFTALPTNIKVSSTDNVYTLPSRQKITLGKILNTVAPDISENVKRTLIELIIVKVKAGLGGCKLEVVSGEDIRWSYHPNNYAPASSGSNINSCMAHEMYQYNIDFYVYNPDTIRMLRAISEAGKVAARALIYTAYRTIEDLVENRNARTLLGRYYTSNTALNAVFDEWARHNADFRIQSQTVFGTKGYAEHNWMWYIPLKYWDLNYYPYMDHFPYLYKNIIDGYGIWTTDPSYMKTHAWIQPSKDSYKDSEGKYDAKLDPLRPGKVWLAESRIWADKDSLIQIKGIWVDKASASPCDVCEELAITKNMRQLGDKRRICDVHKTVSMVTGALALQADCGKCSVCNYYNLKDKVVDNVCEICINKMQTCPTCGLKVDKNFFFKIFDGTSICASCTDKGKYLRCDDCFLIKQGVEQRKDQKNQWLCTDCYKPAVPIEPAVTAAVEGSNPSPFAVATTTNEQYAKDSIDLEISPTAMKINIIAYDSNDNGGTGGN